MSVRLVAMTQFLDACQKSNRLAVANSRNEIKEKMFIDVATSYDLVKG